MGRGGHGDAAAQQIPVSRVSRRCPGGSRTHTGILVHVDGAGGQGSDRVQVFDRTRRLAVVWVWDARTLAAADCCRPLLRLLHWWLADQPWQLVHGAAVGAAAGGVLVTGVGGAGKSTTALACVSAGWRHG